MPSIKIFEEDLTKGGSTTTNTNIVYVPGFMNIDKVDSEEAAPARTPTLCTTVAQFEGYFGTEPAELTDVGNGVDKSYLYAKELIAMGIPVLYESLNGVENEYASVEVSEANMFATLAAAGEDGVYAKLKDRGEYQFKYITSGGYGNFNTTYSYEKDEITRVINDDGEQNLTNVEVLNTLLEEFDKSEKSEDTITFIYKGEDSRGSDSWRYGDNIYTSKTDVDNGITTVYESSTDTETGKITIIPVAQFNTPTPEIDGNTTTKCVSVKDTTQIIITIKKDDEANTISGKWVTTETETKTKKVESATGSNQIAANMAAITLSDIKSGETTGRGDCIALIDHINDENIALTGKYSMYEKICGFAANLDGAENCAAFTPWVNVFFTQYVADNKKAISMPPSFAYLTALAKSLRTNASWLAVAGATRGQIPNLDTDKPLAINKVLTNSIAESYQNKGTEVGLTYGVSINAITNIKPFGYRIWGNRTLKNNIGEGLTATSFLNTKTMVCDVKKVVWDACRKYMFEQNNDVLWLNFKSYIEPTLDQMKTGAGLSGYKIIKEPISANEKAKLKATIKLYPLYAVEDFEVTVQMLDDEIAVS